MARACPVGLTDISVTELTDSTKSSNHDRRVVGAFNDCLRQSDLEGRRNGSRSRLKVKPRKAEICGLEEVGGLYGRSGGRVV